MIKRYRIESKRDFGEQGFLIEGRWVKVGFVVTDGFCNIMPGATWFLTIGEAMDALGIWLAVNGDAKSFWEAVYARKRHVVEIVAPSGLVSYRRPPGDDLIVEAESTPGYSVRLVEHGALE